MLTAYLPASLFRHTNNNILKNDKVLLVAGFDTCMSVVSQSLHLFNGLTFPLLAHFFSVYLSSRLGKTTASATPTTIF